MTPRILADAVVLVHFGFIVFAALGGLLALRWRWMAAIHLPATSWAIFVEWSASPCPLTPFEKSLRRAAGEAGYPGSFVEHYVLPVIYPPGLTVDLQLALGTLLLIFNVAVYIAVWRRG